jgi:hypothetical protein
MLALSLICDAAFACAPHARAQKQQRPAVTQPRAIQEVKHKGTSIDDIYTFRGAFVQAESLSQYLREK